MKEDDSACTPCESDDRGVRTLKIEKVLDGKSDTIADPLAVEATIELVLNGHSVARLRCTPCDVEEMARGFLLTEGWVDKADQIISVEYIRRESRVNAEIGAPEGRIEVIRGQLSIASGCGGGLSRDNLTVDLDCDKKFDLSATIDLDLIGKLARTFEERSQMYRRTRYVHSAMIVRGERILSFAEDIGRHNAVDKVVGMLCRPGFEFNDTGLFTSGRVTLDIAAKMARLRAAFIISRAAASAEAVKAAERFKIAVVGRFRPKSMKIYSAPWRIKM